MEEEWWPTWRSRMERARHQRLWRWLGLRRWADRLCSKYGCFQFPYSSKLNIHSRNVVIKVLHGNIYMHPIMACHSMICLSFSVPDKIVGSASPYADELEHYRLSWHLTTGSTLVISRPLEEGNDWEHNLQFSLTGSTTNLACRSALNLNFPCKTSHAVIQISII